MFGGLGMPEILVILVIVLLIFGAGKLPEIGKSLGGAIKNFKRGLAGEEDIDITPKKKIEEDTKPKE